MFVQLSQDAQGDWCYQDPLQARVASHAMACFAWDLRELDAWVGYGAQWRGFPKARQQLIAGREALTQICRAELQAAPQRSVELKAALLQLQSLALACRQLPQALRERIKNHPLQVDARLRARSRWDAVQEIRIAKSWQHIVHSGQKYGALKILAREFGVSKFEIKRFCKQHLPE